MLCQGRGNVVECSSSLVSKREVESKSIGPRHTSEEAGTSYWLDAGIIHVLNQ